MQTQLRLVDENQLRLQLDGLKEKGGEADEAERAIRQLAGAENGVGIVRVEPLELDTVANFLAIDEVSEERGPPAAPSRRSVDNCWGNAPTDVAEMRPDCLRRT